MVSVRGRFANGVAHPSEQVDNQEGRAVIITFLDEPAALPSVGGDQDWDALECLIDECTVETGIRDLAHQHDHYVHAKPKKA